MRGDTPEETAGVADVCLDGQTVLVTASTAFLLQLQLLLQALDFVL